MSNINHIQDYLKIGVTIVASGLFSSFATVKALEIHISYMKESIIILRQDIEKLNERVDNINK